MKNLIFTAIFLAFTTIAAAQETPQEEQERIEQQPEPDTQRRVERSAKVEAAAKKAESEFQAERQAKDRGMTQKQTTGEQPDSDTVKPVKDPRSQIQDVKRPDRE